jgi:hypothetical protein
MSGRPAKLPGRALALLEPIAYAAQPRPGPGRAHVDLEAPADQSMAERAHHSEPDHASDDALPSAYGTDWLVLMVRDPTRAHAYWDISVARVSGAVGSLGGGKAFLRLIGFPTGLLLAEYEVSAESGRQDITLPEADRSYVAEIALLHYGRKAILARSEVVHAPASVPAPGSAPTFVSRAQQRSALASGLGLGDLPALAPSGWTASLGLAHSLFSGVSPISMGSETRLSPFGSWSRPS